MTNGLESVAPVEPWWYPGRLRSVLDMQRVYIEGLINGVKRALQLIIVSKGAPDGHTLSADDLAVMREQLGLIEDAAAGMEARATLERCRELLAYERLTVAELQHCITEMTDDLIRESKSRIFYMMSLADAQLYEADSADYFGNRILERFPDTQYDLEECMRCMALGRWTAAVMHSCRSLEVVVRAIWRSLHHSPETTLTLDEGFNKYAGDAAAFMRDHRGPAVFGDEEWKRRKSHFEVAATYLAGLRVIRNGAMHLDQKYTEQEARDEVNALRRLLQHGASFLHQSGRFEL